MGLRVRTPDVNAARHHSGTKANARFPEHFLRDMNKQDPHHNFRTKWYSLDYRFLQNYLSRSL